MVTYRTVVTDERDNSPGYMSKSALFKRGRDRSFDQPRASRMGVPVFGGAWDRGVLGVVIFWVTR